MSDHKPNHFNNLTLILNASYLPLGVCNSKRAICLYFLDKVDIYYLIFSTAIFILISLLLKYLNKKLIFVVLISYFIYVVFIYLRMV